MNFKIKDEIWILLSFGGLFLMAVLFRPLLPIDETRYLTVAWEMFLRHDWFAPLTMNGEPYHHKPPLLFWLINAVWAITGPSRWAATIPPVAAGIACIFLTRALAHTLFTNDREMVEKTPFIIASSAAFLVYSSMVMFDVTLTAFVLGALLALVRFSQTGHWRYVPLMALLLGLGVLTKGPVAYLHVVFPMLLGPLWHKEALRKNIWYRACLSATLLSVLPVMMWLVPVLRQSDNQFAFWLLWEQTAGRITGNFNDAHVRPFYFYLPILPLLVMPWILFPRFWQEIRFLPQRLLTRNGYRFLLCWIVPVFLCFSFISGKQPHYLVPLVPGLTLLLAVLLKDTSMRTVQRTFLAVYMILLATHLIGSQTFLKDYDLRPIADYVRAHSDRDWAFVKKYHGEINFLARMEDPVHVLPEQSEVNPWLTNHPEGLFIMRYKDDSETAPYREILSIPYRGKTLGIFAEGTGGPGGT